MSRMSPATRWMYALLASLDQPQVPATTERGRQVQQQIPPGVVGVARISQVAVRIPTKSGQAPYSGIKYATGGVLVDSALHSSRDGAL